jgi:hypothetical protein
MGAKTKEALERLDDWIPNSNMASEDIRYNESWQVLKIALLAQQDAIAHITEILDDSNIIDDCMITLINLIIGQLSILEV